MTRRDSAWSTNWVPYRPVHRELCIIEHPSGPCARPRQKGSQLCGPCNEETNRLAAERLTAGWAS